MKISPTRALVLLAMAIQLAACGSDSDSPPPTTDPQNPILTEPLVKLTPFESQAEFDTFLRSAANTVVQPGGFVQREDGAVGAPPATDTGAPGSGATPLGPDHSTTNIQEPGVDEADIVKTDGTYIYVAGNQKVSIVTAAPAPAMAGEINVPGYVHNLLLTEDKKLIVFYSPDGATLETSRPVVAYFYYALAGVMIVDVNDPANPSVLRSSVIEGQISAIRQIGAMLYVVLSSTAFPEPPALSSPNRPTEQDGIAVPDAASKNATRTATLPQIIELNADGSIKSAVPAVAVTDILHPDQPRGTAMTLIAGLNLTDPSAPFTSTGYLGYANVVYASSQAIYITDPQWIGDVIIGLPGIGVSEPVFGGGGGAAPPSTPVRAVTDGPHTVIHKFTLAEAGASLAASGHISGFLLNQYALSESGNFLRAASSMGWNLGAEVSVIEQQGSDLVVVGNLPEIGAGENLFAARFMGDRGYLVTFLQTDPLFTVDLSDPRAPKLIGELVMPGFSDYLHPLDDNHLLGLGRDADPTTGGRRGVQLSVFDVTDFAQPAITDKAVVGTSATDSEATSNPKAFNYWPTQQLIAFPIREYKDSFAPSFEPRIYEGLYVFKLLPDFKLEFIGAMGKTVDYYPNWRRALFVGEQLFSVNEFEISVAAIGSVDQITASLELAPANPTPPPVVFPAQ